MFAYSNYTRHFLSANFVSFGVHVNLFRACFEFVDEVVTRLQVWLKGSRVQALSEDFWSQLTFEMIIDEFSEVTPEAFMVLCLVQEHQKSLMRNDFVIEL